MDAYSKREALILPILSRIYTTENFPHILYDEKVLELKDKIPLGVKCMSKMLQYTLLSGSIRSKKIDIKIDDFLFLNPDGIIIELACSTSTAFYRSKTTNKWFLVDTSDVMAFRKTLFDEQDNKKCIESEIFDTSKLHKIIKENPNCPILIVSCGTFIYYENEKVINLLKELSHYYNIEVVFDAVNLIGQKRMAKFYKYLGIDNYKSMFCVKDKISFENDIKHAVLLDDEPFYENIPKKKFKLATRIYMILSDLFKMINIYHIRAE